jgi:hypothetical protein
LTGVTLKNTDIILGPIRSDDDYLGPIFDFSMLLSFDASSLVDDWRQSIIQKAKEQSGCSDARVHTIDFVIGPDDTWIGTFHLDYKKRACFDYWWFGVRHAQIDLAEVNIVYTNTLKIGIDSTANKIITQFTPTAVDNVPDWLKPILQFFEVVIGILSVGFVSPGDHVLSGINQQDQILSDMGKYAVGLINGHLGSLSSAPIATDKQLDYLNHLVHTSIKFSKPSPGHLLINLLEAPSKGNLPPAGGICRVHDSFRELRVQDQNIPYEGFSYLVKRGDSGWKLAEQFYGNGRYFLLISAANNITDYALDLLPTGRHLRIETVATMRSRPDMVLIMNGQSVWQIASGGDKGNFGSLLRANANWFKNPNLIYPIQVLKLPASTQNANPAARR